MGPIGPLGPKGDKGDKGQKGDKGIQGQKGEQVCLRSFSNEYFLLFFDCVQLKEVMLVLSPPIRKSFLLFSLDDSPPMMAPSEVYFWKDL